MAVNEVLYPEQLDTKDNFPDLEIVTQDSFVEINRNAEAIIKIEEVLGINPQIGPFTVDPSTATVSQRIRILEDGMSAGRFRMNQINVANALIVKTENGVTEALIGRNRTDTDGYGTAYGNVMTTVRGTLEVRDISTFRERVLIDSDRNLVTASSRISQLGNRRIDPQTGYFDYSQLLTTQNIENNTIVSIQDENPNFVNDRNLETYQSLQHVSLWVLGNVQIDGILRAQELMINHSALREIDTTPIVDSTTNAASAMTKFIHVKWGDWHSHTKKPGSFDRTSASPHWEVEPTLHNYGIIDHKNLIGIHTRNQVEDTVDSIGFIPKAGIAYHVTGGDDHDHDPAGTLGGAQINHRFLSNAASDTGHVTDGDLHNHTQGAGAVVSHTDLINRGIYSHTEIDAFIDEGHSDAQYLNQLLGGAQQDSYNANNQLAQRKIFKDTDKTTLLEQHDFVYDNVNTLFITQITRTIYDAQFGTNLTKTVTYTLENDGTHYTSMTWTPATEV